MTYARRKRAKAGDDIVVRCRQPSAGLGEGSSAGRVRRATSKAPVYQPSSGSSDDDDVEDPDAEMESESDDDDEEISPPVSEQAANPQDRPLSEWTMPGSHKAKSSTTSRQNLFFIFLTCSGYTRYP